MPSSVSQAQVLAHGGIAADQPKSDAEEDEAAYLGGREENQSGQLVFQSR